MGTNVVRITVLVDMTVDSIVELVKLPFPRVETDRTVEVLKDIILPPAVAELRGKVDRMIPV